MGSQCCGSGEKNKLDKTSEVHVTPANARKLAVRNLKEEWMREELNYQMDVINDGKPKILELHVEEDSTNKENS